MCVCVYVCLCVCICVYLCMCLIVCVCMRVCVCVCMCECMCVSYTLIKRCCVMKTTSCDIKIFHGNLYLFFDSAKARGTSPKENVIHYSLTI